MLTKRSSKIGLFYLKVRNIGIKKKPPSIPPNGGKIGKCSLSTLGRTGKGYAQMENLINPHPCRLAAVLPLSPKERGRAD